MTLAAIILLPLLVGSAAAWLLRRRGLTAVAVASACVAAAALALLAWHAPRIYSGEVLVQRWTWLPELGLDLALRLDGFGLMFAFLILGIGLLVILYARYYLTEEDAYGRLYALLMVFMAAMLGIVLSENVLLLFVFWELTSLSSFLLIGFRHHAADSRRGARMAITVTGGGGLALLAGLLLLGNAAGSYEMSDLLRARDAIHAHPHYTPALLLILLGAFTKSAQFPFHFWLPEAMAAPTPRVGLSALRHDGEGGCLPARTALSGARRHGALRVRREHGRARHVRFRCVCRRVQARHQRPSRVFDDQPPGTDHVPDRARYADFRLSRRSFTS